LPLNILLHDEGADNSILKNHTEYTGYYLNASPSKIGVVVRHFPLKMVICFGKNIPIIKYSSSMWNHRRKLLPFKG